MLGSHPRGPSVPSFPRIAPYIGVSPGGSDGQEWENAVISGRILLAACAATASLWAQSLPTGVTIEPFYDVNKAGLSFAKDQQSVVGMFEVPGKPQHFLVVGFFGYIWSLYPDTTRTYPPGAVKDYAKKQVADFNAWVMKGWEQGALGGAFDPAFSKNRYFYVIYNKYANPSAYHGGVKPNSSDGHTNAGLVVVDRYRLSADYATLTRDTTVFSAQHGTGYGSSNLVFGKDGMLYITADSYSHNSWDSTHLMRKVLRIDVSRQDPGKMYAIPTDNPFYNAANPAVKKEIFAFGFRNTYSLQADYLTGSLWGGEVGQGLWEEVNIIQAGRNYGWSNGGDYTAFGNNSIGIEGPCSPSQGGFTSSNNDTAQTGNASQMTPYRRVYKGRTYTCADFTNGTWNFTHQGQDAYGTKTSLPGTGISCIILGPAFRGNPLSPFYGYHFITDVGTNVFVAAKEGVAAPVKVGGVPAGMSFSGDRLHNGITSFAEDSYGNQYVTMLSSSTNGAFQWHDIYRITHPQLTPLEVPRRQVVPEPGTVDVLPGSFNWRKSRQGGLITMLSLGGRKSVHLPAGHSTLHLHGLDGALLWSGRGVPGTSVALPESMGARTVWARFLP